MRDYSKVSPQFWTGTTGRALRGDACSQLVALHLLTSPHRNMIGFYYLPLAFLIHDSGIPFKGASKGLRRCIEVGFCGYDWDAEVVWIYNMAADQLEDELKPGDKRIKGVQNAYDSLPANCFLGEFYDKYAGPFKMTSPRGTTLNQEGASMPLQSPIEANPILSLSQSQSQSLKKEASQATPAPREAEKYSVPDEALALASLLFDLHREKIDRGFSTSPSRLESWARDIERLHRLDARPWPDIEAAIRWVKEPGCFWGPNIVSGAKLRDKFPVLYGQMQRPGAAPKVLGRTAILEMAE